MLRRGEAQGEEAAVTLGWVSSAGEEEGAGVVRFCVAWEDGVEGLMGQAEVELAVDAARAAATAKDEGSGLVKEESFAERIAPLAEHITAYILDGTVTAQEKRWRTNMKRDMSRSFRIQRELIDSQLNKQREEVQHRFDDVHTKLDKLLDHIEAG